MKIMNGTREASGFTLIEIVIVLAIIAVLAGILSPSLTRFIGDARIRKAEVDTRNIGAAISMMYGDTGHWPIWSSGTATGAGDTKFDILVSNDGTKPDESGSLTVTTGPWPTANSDDLDDQLLNNAPSYPTTGRQAWRGPYLESVQADPWDSKYMINVKFLQPANIGGRKPVFVISAGSNKLVETDFQQNGPGLTVGGDDIVFRLK